jgi:hypothetical protein
MLDAANEALEFVRGKRLVLSLVKELEIIGEAAGKISAETEPNTVLFPGRTSVECVIV